MSQYLPAFVVACGASLSSAVAAPFVIRFIERVIRRYRDRL
ncbi:hypothetical protein [Streptomyces sp. NPDC058614]